MTDDTKPPAGNTHPFRVVASNEVSSKSDSQNTEEGANDEALMLRVTAIEEDHRDLGNAIEALEAMPHHNRLTVARLKKKKLQLKDEIQKLKNSVTPDIIA